MERATAPDVLESFNPATGERIGAVPVLTPGELRAVMADVAEVQPFWAQLPLFERARYMRRAAQVVIDHLDELASLLASEQGKPVTEAYLMELVPAVDTLHWIASRGPKFLADQPIRHTQPFFVQKRSFFSLEPLGVVGVLGSWSLPWSIPFIEAAVALMCGNGVVLRPSSLTPLIGRRIQDVFERAGLPDGVIQVVQGETAAIEAGAARVFSEPHGKGAQLVLASAHLGHAVDGCLWGSFGGAGQSAASIERAYVERSVADPFVRGVVEGAKRLRVGDPLDPSTEIGPLVSDEQLEHVRTLVDDAVARGATLHCGGPAGGRYFAPAVLTGVTPEMRLVNEEIRGPVVPILAVRDEEEGIRLANSAELGRAASVWSLERDRAQRTAGRLRAETVWLNDHLASAGPGRSRDRYGFYECVTVKHVSWDPSRTRNPWWFPYDETLGTALHSAAQLAFGRDADKRDALKRGAVPLARLVRKIGGS